MPLGGGNREAELKGHAIATGTGGGRGPSVGSGRQAGGGCGAKPDHVGVATPAAEAGIVGGAGSHTPVTPVALAAAAAELLAAPPAAEAEPAQPPEEAAEEEDV